MIPIQSLSERERSALSRLRQILREPGLMRASLIELRHTCGKQGCRCLRAKCHRHISWYASQSRKGKLRRKFVPRQKLEQVRRWLERYGETKQLLDRISDEYWSRLDKRRA
jgi:hypothetical protein